MAIDRKALFASLDGKAKATPPKDDEPRIEGDDGLDKYRQIIAAVKANDPEALKTALEASE